MAISYRLTSDELSVLCWLTGNEKFSILDINSDFNLEKFNASLETIKNKGIVKESDQGYIIDPVVNYIVNIMSDSSVYLIGKNGENIITFDNDMVLIMKKDMRDKRKWHIYPYKNFIDALMDDKESYLDDELVHVYDRVSGETLECSWKAYCERVIKSEQGVN